ncbi:MAG: TIGR02301 family protein [Alphaproteobacteria bacterium]
MGQLSMRLLLLAFGALWVATGTVAYAPKAAAQFGWFFQPQKKAKPKKRKVRRARPQGDDLAPIKQRESLAPPPPDDRPYDNKLMKLAEILGAVHYLRELCGADEGQLWRDQMKAILKNEGTTAVRRAKLVKSFNDGYRGYRRTYRTCTQSATLATKRFSAEGAQIAASLAQTSVFASGPQVQVQDIPAPEPETTAAPAPPPAAPPPSARAN